MTNFHIQIAKHIERSLDCNIMVQLEGNLDIEEVLQLIPPKPYAWVFRQIPCKKPKTYALIQNQNELFGVNESTAYEFKRV